MLKGQAGQLKQMTHHKVQTVRESQPVARRCLQVCGSAKCFTHDGNLQKPSLNLFF